MPLLSPPFGSGCTEVPKNKENLQDKEIDWWGTGLFILDNQPICSKSNKQLTVSPKVPLLQCQQILFNKVKGTDRQVDE